MTDLPNRRAGDDRLDALIVSHQDVRVQLAEVTQELKNYEGNQEHLLMLMQRSLDRHEQQLNGFNGTPGVRLDVDRLKQWKAHIIALWAVIVGVTAKKVIELVVK